MSYKRGSSWVRIGVCIAIGLYLISLGSTKDIFGILWTALGILVVIYGFAPELAKAIIDAIVTIVSLPFGRRR